MVRNSYRTKEQQRLHERQAWLRTLDYIQQETIDLRNNMVDIVSNDVDPVVLENVEVFQNEFLKKDTVVSLLRHDIAKQLNQKENDGQTDNKFEKLRTDLRRVEQEFSKLKFDYYNYFSHII